jgi:hypothetical protein
MTLITSAIPNLINGVSQQPSTLRLASQATGQVNFLSSVVDGLKRRPGSRHVAKVSETRWDSAFLHTINRDQAERYLVSIKDGALTVLEAETGVARTVNAPAGFGYLSGGTKDSYRAVTVADYTFLVNKTKGVTLSSSTTPARVNQAMITVKSGNYGKQYKVYLNGVLRGAFSTRKGNDPKDVFDVRTQEIARQLHDTLNGTALMPRDPVDSDTAPRLERGSGDFSMFTYSLLADTVVITSSSTAPFTVTVEDDSGGASVVAIYEKVQRFSDLPKVAPNGFITEITGDNASTFDNYFVKFVASGSTGVWEECPKGGETFKFDPSTMPHVLVREADGTFTFKPADWVDRKVGDRARIPDTSFVGRPISDVFFYRNRLGLLSDENIILSKQGEFFDFWRETATTVLDTDPIDIAVSNTRVSILNHALPFNQSLLLFSDNAQFILKSADILSAETAFVVQATEFESIAKVRPVGVGQYVYFPVPRGAHAGVREYYVDEGNAQNDALDVTSHCPRYIPKDIFKLAASTSEDMVVALTATEPNTIWVYKFYYGEGGKLQSSWSQWVLAEGDTILSAEFIESSMYLVVARADGTYIDRLSIESGALDAGATLHYHVDRGLALTGGVYDAGNDHTTFTLPYTTSEPLWVFVRGDDALEAETYTVAHSRPTTSTIRITGNWTARNLFAGVKFTSLYTFSTLYLRSQENSGNLLSLDDGRLQLRRMSVNFAESGYFVTSATPEGRATSTKIFTGHRLASASATLGELVLTDGRFSFPLMGRNKGMEITLSSDHFLPCAFTSAEWEATYHTRAKRV